MISFEEKIAELRNLRKQLIIKERNLEDSMKKEKDEALKTIGDKYLPEIKKTSHNILKSEENIVKFNENVVKVSTFDCKFITKIMRELIRIYEGENFIYKNIRYCPNSKQRIKQNRAQILISDKRKDFISDGVDISRLYSLQKNGDGIILDWNERLLSSDTISFYQLTDDDELKTNIKLNRFPYLKQFIDFIISYCLVNENYMELNLTEEQIENLKKQFLLDNLDNIKKYQEMVKFNEQLKVQEEVEKNAEYRNKQLTKALNKKI